MRTLIQDLRFTLRQLIKLPGFTMTTVLSLALGIGATTAVFSIVYGILVNPYPYSAPDRMIHLRLVQPNGDLDGFSVTTSQWETLRKSPVIEDAFLTDQWNLTVTGSDLPEDVNGDYVTSNMFNYMGVPAVFGRGLQPSDSIAGHDPQPVAVLSYAFWRRHFNGDPTVVGKTFQLVRKTYTIVGVASPRFTWDDADVYLPMKLVGDLPHGYVGARLKPGVTHAQADAALQPLVEQFAKQTPKDFPQGKLRFKSVGLNEDFIKQLGGTLALLFGAVALLLLIGCGNVSILLLARATTRQHEFALRAAIGAGRQRLIRQLLTEALLLSLTGAGLGLLIAYQALDTIVRFLPKYSYPHEAAIHINLPVLIFCLLAAVGTGLLFGLWPAWQLSHPEVSQVLQTNARKTTRGVSGRRLHNMLIGAQVALTLIMLAGAGAAIEGFVKLAHRPLGYDPHNVMSVGIPIHEGTYKSWPERVAYYSKMYDAVAAVPGVKDVGVSSNATPPSNGFTTKLDIVGLPSANDQRIRFNMVSTGYFNVLRIPLVAGKFWTESESRRGAEVAVVDESFARRFFPKGDAIGHVLKFPEVTSTSPYSFVAPGFENGVLIVGVVADKLDDGLDKPVMPEIFVPYTCFVSMYTQFLVRADVSPLTLLHTIRQKINLIDQDQQTIGNVQDLEHWISNQPEWASGQLIAWLFGAFAALALALAAVGLYSVVSYTVAQRTNEFGIRVALGANKSHLFSIVMRSTVLSVSCGIAAGAILTLALNRLLASWDASVAHNPLLLALAALVLASVAALACAIPARRAAAIEPMTAIRSE